MRTSVPMAMSNAAFLAVLIAGAGCDDLSAGQRSDDSGPPRLLRIMVQDELPLYPPYTRGFATDLLADASILIGGKPLACSADLPCPATFLVGGAEALPCAIPEGMTQGLCPDPLAPAPVAIGVLHPEIPFTAGGLAIRLVLSKLLDHSIETVTNDPATGTSYVLPVTPMALIDSDGRPVATADSYDPSGSPDTTSDPIVSPFGPALVMKPLAALAPNGQYTIRLDPTQVKDRGGKAAVDKQGMALPAPFTISFTTEDLLLLGVLPDLATEGTVVRPNDVLQLSFNAAVAPGASTFTLRRGAAEVPITWFFDQGLDPLACADNTRLVNIVATRAASAVDLEPGDYTLTVEGVPDATGRGTPYSATFSFTVSATVDPADPSAVGNFVLPWQCATGDGADGGAPSDGGADA